MYDLEIHLKNVPGSLERMGKALGDAGVSVEGGGAWTVKGESVAHFLFEDGEAAKAALEAADIKVGACKKVLVQKLKQDVPGQLGLLTGLMAKENVNIEVLYSDHANQLILVVDDYNKGLIVSNDWKENTQSKLNLE